MVGAGLFGLFMALLLSKDGYLVDVYEKRKRVFISEGRRAPLVLNYRSLIGLQEIGI